MHLPVCEGKAVSTSTRRWYRTRHLTQVLWTCESCYLDKIALTAFNTQFELVPGRVTRVLDDEEVVCGLSVPPIMVALETAKMKGDCNVFSSTANVITRSKPLQPRGNQRPALVHTRRRRRKFSRYAKCYAGIVAPCEMVPFFTLAARDPGLNLLCDLNLAAPRFLIFVQKLAQAVDVGDFSAFNNYVLESACMRVIRSSSCSSSFLV